jgi:predicted anti-sigma-YlaC factor YlaD
VVEGKWIMKSRNNKELESSEAATDKGTVHKMGCEEIQGVLFSYLAHELSESQAVLVREHIRRCPKCRSEASEIEATMELLKSSDAPRCDIRLSEDRRERIIWAAFHPFMNWVYTHHRIVSLLLALLVLAATFFALRNFAIFRHIRFDDGVCVKIIKTVPEQSEPHE